MKDVERKKKQPDLYFMYGFEEEEKKNTGKWIARENYASPY